MRTRKIGTDTFFHKEKKEKRCLSLFSLIAVCLLAATGPAHAAANPLFDEANAKYQSGDFRGAADIYRKLIDTGRATQAVHYNLGNAALRLNRKGEALLNYERARKITPRDKDLLWNISVLKNALPDRIEDTSSHWLLAPVQKVKELVATDELAVLFSAGLGILALASLFSFLFPARAGFWRFLGTSGVLLALSASILFVLEWRDSSEPNFVVLDREITAYYGPSDKETRAFTLHEGAEGRIIDRSQDWVYIALKNKNTGWVRKSAGEIV